MPLLTITQLGAALNLSRATLYRLRKCGIIKAVKRFGSPRFDLDQVKRSLERQGSKVSA